MEDKQYDWAYIPESYLSLLLRISANNAEFLPNCDWVLNAVGKLLEQSMMIELFDFDDVSFIDTEFIETPYQWLYIYQQFARASHIVHKLPNEVSTKPWSCFAEENWIENLETKDLKNYSLWLMQDFVKVCTFPNLSNSWLTLFKTLHENKCGWGEFQHPIATTLKYDSVNHAILDQNDQPINWYDIVYLSISPKSFELVKHIEGLRFSPHNTFCLVQSFNSDDLT